MNKKLFIIIGLLFSSITCSMGSLNKQIKSCPFDAKKINELRSLSKKVPTETTSKIYSKPFSSSFNLQKFPKTSTSRFYKEPSTMKLPAQTREISSWKDKFSDWFDTSEEKKINTTAQEILNEAGIQKIILSNGEFRYPKEYINSHIPYKTEKNIWQDTDETPLKITIKKFGINNISGIDNQHLQRLQYKTVKSLWLEGADLDQDISPNLKNYDSRIPGPPIVVAIDNFNVGAVKALLETSRIPAKDLGQYEYEYTVDRIFGFKKNPLFTPILNIIKQDIEALSAYQNTAQQIEALQEISQLLKSYGAQEDPKKAKSPARDLYNTQRFKDLPKVNYWQDFYKNYFRNFKNRDKTSDKSNQHYKQLASQQKPEPKFSKEDQASTFFEQYKLALKPTVTIEELLEIKPNATTQQAKSEYLKKVQEIHPDKYKNQPVEQKQANEILKTINKLRDKKISGTTLD